MKNILGEVIATVGLFGIAAVLLFLWVATP
jgi:hypothetical protein